MVRRYDELVEVRSRPARAAAGATTAAGAMAEAPADEPEAFLWRGRVYRVREVLGHWHERRSWWKEHAARAVHGDSGEGAGEAGGVAAPGADREMWRVEASAGRSAASGVYDLCRSDDAGHPWQLLRLAD